MVIVAPQIEAYATRHSSPESELLKRLVRVTQDRTSAPQMQVGHLEGSFLRLLVKISSAARILEIGTFTGYSALTMAEGLPKGGRLITCDIDPETTKIAQALWQSSPHGKKIALKIGPAIETIRRLKGLFDLVFVDADKENYIRYWELCVPKVRRGGLLLADNVLWSGRVLHPADRTDRAIVAFNQRVVADRRVEVVMLPIRDGLTLARKA